MPPKSCRRSGQTIHALGASLLALLATRAPAAAESFVNFETGQVRPLALTPDGSRLLAINTPDNRLEIFDATGGTLAHVASVSVGLEPIAVAARSDSEAWVVNHLSDSVSIVDLASDPPHVVRTLLTCDEPRDIVFAGPDGNRAFVTAARRGQACSVPTMPTTPGLGRAVVQVYDATTIDNTLAGTPLASLELFGDTPRALARSLDGSTVYAAVFHSGNRTTSIRDGLVCDGGASAPPCVLSGASVPGGLPAPNMNVDGEVGPEVGLIVRFDQVSGAWEDTLGRDWSDAVRFDLPDLDVFAIDANAALLTSSFAHVGTVLFNLAVNPVSGKIYVSNTEARNEVRFEGPGLAFGSTTVQGHLHEARITVIDGASVEPRHLNKHIDYAQRPAPAGVKEDSLATPLGMAVTSDGEKLYVAAFGSSKLGVFDTGDLESDAFVPDAGSHIPLSGGGPTGIVLDEVRDRLYVFTRFDSSISVVSLSGEEEIDHVPLFHPEPPEVSEGRPVLYDAVSTSSNGEASCSSCHVFGDFDSLAWDLGNPDDSTINNPLPFRIPPLFDTFEDFHPLKGPMTTQSLRGMANNGSMHWRGDRTGGNDLGGSAFDEDAAFKKFNVAFPGLIGRESEISDADMQAFTDFILTVTYPPNPIRALDNTLSEREQEGADVYFGPITDVLFNCNGCHRLDPAAGFFGTDGFGTFEGETQMFKVPHLRNAYQKIGMFGIASDVHQGPQVRGFGFLHDGSIDTVRNFLSASVFSLTNTEQNRLERFVLAFDSDLAPIVGQQITLRSTSGANVGNRINLLLARDDAGECEVVVKGTIAGEQRGGYRIDTGEFQMDRAAEVLSDLDVRAHAATAGQELTYTCAPPGSGERIGVDRDEDGFFDRDELDAGADPADLDDFPVAVQGIRTMRFSVRNDDRPPIDPQERRLSFRSGNLHGDPSGIVIPAWEGEGDPTIERFAGAGARLMIYPVDGSKPATVLALPAALWSHFGTATNPGYRYRDPGNANGPITAVTMRGATLTVRGEGAELYELSDAPQGALALRLRIGREVELCAVAPPKSPESKNDTSASFTGERSPAPGTCPEPP